ncbi:hypothetical protein [Bradyrhizobium murdochi]|uniref:hypothetical protein n=1 Tax=Bradyrhizobium murdochi TaxID=1038859 RepID=UPI0004873465|nr:hypothetical protein [Bradyrhizobium murdochi]
MGAVYRRAMFNDASRLCDIRRRSIIELVPPTMTAADAQAWAAKLTRAGMEQKLRELEVWVAERAAPADNLVDPTVSSGLDWPS